jgi:hypothetical protein
MSDEEMKPFEVSEELQKALDKTLTAIEGRSFSERNSGLGKMIKCQVCGTRHRQHERVCEQKFKYLYTEEETDDTTSEVTTTDFFATAIPTGKQPTKRQVVGAAAFAKKRFHPHHSKIKLQLIERVRVVFERLGFNLEVKSEGTFEKPEESESQKQFQKDLHRARVVAARQLRKERRNATIATRKRQDISRRVNRGLAKAGSR